MTLTLASVSASASSCQSQQVIPIVGFVKKIQHIFLFAQYIINNFAHFYGPGASFTKLTCVFDVGFGNFLL
jgi:hypothetical protein